VAFLESEESDEGENDDGSVDIVKGEDSCCREEGKLFLTCVLEGKPLRMGSCWERVVVWVKRMCSSVMVNMSAFQDGGHEW